MVLDQQKLLLLAAAATLRLLLFILFPSLSPLLGGLVEISTPVTGFKRFQEGLFLYAHNVSPYDGGVFHQAPLLLSLFSILPDYRFIPLATHVVYIAVDLLSAHALMQIAESDESTTTRFFTTSRKGTHRSTVAIGAAFLFNPLSIASCLALPTSIFTNFAILQSISMAVSGNVVKSLLALSMASYLSLYPILLAPPLAILAFDRLTLKNKKEPASYLIFFASYAIGLAVMICGLLLLSYVIIGASWEFLASTYGVQLLLSDLTPNVGLWWYFFIEMFDSFREFFLAVFWLHMASYVGGFTIKIRRQPLFVITSLLGIFATFKPYPSISDTSLYLGMLPLYRHIFPLMRYSFLSVATLLYSSCLGPAFYYLWIYAGSGNANFFYAITLVWSLGLTVIVADSIYALLRDEWEIERPEMKGKEVKRI